MQLSNQKGFAVVFVFLAALITVVIGGIFVYNAQRNYKQSGSQGLYGKCEGKGTTKLNTFPLEPKDIELIVPMGRVQDSHVTPTDHQYIIPKEAVRSIVTDNPGKYQIKAPFNGYIVNVELFKEPVEKAYRNQSYRDNYLVVFEYSCDYYARLIHIDTLSEKVSSSFKFDNPDSQHPSASLRFPVKEGEVIGTVGPHSFDFQIMDTTNPDKSFIGPQNIDPWTPVTVDTFNYLSDSLKSELLAKNLRTRPPLGGKVGYDEKGTLLGNWFKVGVPKQRQGEYWVNELSLVYDHIDESQIRVSLGDFGGHPKAFGVKGNLPDPKDVTKNSGIIKYELYRHDYYDLAGNLWDQVNFVPNLVSKNTNDLAGTVLFELLDDGKLRVETFPGKTADQISGFTDKAIIYER